MSPIYSYKNLKTGEIFEKIRSFKDSKEPFILEDGTICERILFPNTKRGPWNSYKILKKIIKIKRGFLKST